MKKYTILILLVLGLLSCGKEVGVDGVKINTQDGGVKILENEIKFTSNEGEATIGVDGLTAEINEQEVSVSGDGLQTQTSEGNLEINKKGLQGNIDGAGEISITNDGIQASGVNISSGNVAAETINNAIENEMNDMEIMNSLDDLMNDALNSQSE